MANTLDSSIFDTHIVKNGEMLDGMQIVISPHLARELRAGEIRQYVQSVRATHPTGTITRLTFEPFGPDGKSIDMEFIIRHTAMERIRRITGYLVGTIDRWNNAKQAEERDRVKHPLS